jgi:hypothetical protein
VNLDLIDAMALALTPAVGEFIVYPDTVIDNTAQALEPAINGVGAPLVDNEATAIEPQAVTRPVSQDIRFVDDVYFLDNMAEALELTEVFRAPPRNINTGLIDNTATPLQPRVARPERTTIIKKARWNPMVRLKARYQPVIYKRANESRQE